MELVGKWIARGIQLRESLEQKYGNPLDLQKNELLKLMIAARDTSFGQYYSFKKILKLFKNEDAAKAIRDFQKSVPIHEYDDIFERWWSLTRKGHKDVCWPGKIKYFALSSGTSGDSTKYIPVTKEMLNSIRRTSVRQLLTLPQYNLPPEIYHKGVLMLGGSTNLKKGKNYHDADLSGITASNIPFWFQRFYKPGKKISKDENWGRKLDRIVDKAKKWDIGIIVGVPAWIQMLLERIIKKYHVKNIHEIWPNLHVYVHGGVAFEPYQNSFAKLLGRPVSYIQTYLASEGFLAYQCKPNTKSMKLVLNNGIFYEFIPFNDFNFDSEGRIKRGASTVLIDDVEENLDYAILISTCSGAWRYLIGDVVKFSDKGKSEIIITGRTKHFLSLCGEHLSVDNMNKAIELIEEELDIEIKEYTVTGLPNGSSFVHKWYVGCDNDIGEKVLRKALDEKLKMLNDDYRIERNYALKEVQLKKIPVQNFYTWLKLNGKEGGQSKFPRVLKGKKFQEWETFLNNHSN